MSECMKLLSIRHGESSHSEIMFWAYGKVLGVRVYSKY